MYPTAEAARQIVSGTLGALPWLFQLARSFGLGTILVIGTLGKPIHVGISDITIVPPKITLSRVINSRCLALECLAPVRVQCCLRTEDAASWTSLWTWSSLCQLSSLGTRGQPSYGFVSRLTRSDGSRESRDWLLLTRERSHDLRNWCVPISHIAGSLSRYAACHLLAYVRHSSYRQANLEDAAAGCSCWMLTLAKQQPSALAAT